MTDAPDPSYLTPDRSRRRRVPKWLWLVIAPLVVGGGSLGTFAAFTASTANDASFATGSLILTNTVEPATTCLSAVGGVTDVNSNPNCSKLFDLAVAKPGDAATANLDLVNDGSLDASELRMFAASACAPGTVATETFHGTGNPCGSVELSIQEFDSPASRTALDASDGHCWFGGNPGANNLCGFDPGQTLTTFATSCPTFDDACDIGAMNDQSTRYFQIGVKLDPTAGNDLQGRSARLDISWMIVE